LGIILMGPLQHGGLALATSLASVVNLCLLVWALKKKIGLLKWRGFLLSTFRTLVCSAVMALAVYASMALMLQPQSKDFWQICTGLIVTILIGIFSYAGCSLALRSPEMVSIVQVVQNIANRKPKSGVLR
jgi:putative peptidoglycan lipid II flippase